MGISSSFYRPNKKNKISCDETPKLNKIKILENKSIEDIILLQNIEEINKVKENKKNGKTKTKKSKKPKKPKKTKQTIPEAVRLKVWSTYIGINQAEGKCFCCRDQTIHITHFQCGHIMSEHAGGQITIQNLRPICKKCNCSMGVNNMVEFMEKYGFDTSHI
jgi:hypothetical protein